MSSPSKVTKVNYLYIRYLRFRSVRGDFLEGHSYASRCLFPLFPVPIPFLPSTKSGFLCAFGVWNPCFQTFRAQNRHFCALLPFGTPVFEHFEHKIEVFVLFWGLEPSFSGFSSTKSRFLCSRGWESGIGKRNRGDAYHFAVAPTPSHQRTSRTRTVLGRLGAALVPSQSRYGTALD